METKKKKFNWKVILFALLTFFAAIACVFGIVMACHGGDYIIPGIITSIVGAIGTYAFWKRANRHFEKIN